MRNLARLSLAFAFIAVPISSVFSADIVYRKGSTARVGGEITAQSKTDITIKAITGGPQEIPANEVASVQWDGEPVTLNIARDAEEKGRLDDALSKYEEVAGQVDAQDTDLKTDLEFLIARVTGKMAKGDPGKVDDAIQKLSGYTTAHANTFRYYDALMLLGETHLLKGDYANAENTFKTLEQAPWDDYKMASQIAQGRLLLRKDNIKGAQELFESVASKSAKTDAEKARQYEARLGVATCLQRSSQFEKAAAELDQVIKEAPASDTKTMGEAYLRKGDNLLFADKKKDALLAYLHVDVLFSSEPDLHAEALYHLATLWNEVGQPGRAADARTKLAADYPNSEWAKKMGG